MRASAFRRWWLGALLVLLAAVPGLLVAQAPLPPLKATLFFRNPPPGVTFDPTSPVTIVLQLENVSGGPVITTEGFSGREHWRRLFFTDPVGGTITNVAEASVHGFARVGHCFSRQRVLLRPTAIPVVPVEVLAGPPSPFVLEYTIDDARRFWDLSRGGSYTVNARIPLLTFDVADPEAIIRDCDQFNTDVVNVAATSGRHPFTIISNTLAFTIQNTAPTISNIPDQQTDLNRPTDPIPFTVGDADTEPASLILSGHSSDQALVPDANIVFGGSGTSRTVTITPAADQSGTATITITVSDGALTASDSFVLTVSATPVKAKEKTKGGS